MAILVLVCERTYQRENGTISYLVHIPRSDGYLRNKAGKLNADYRTGKAFYQGNYTDNDVRVQWHAGMSIKDFWL